MGTQWTGAPWAAGLVVLSLGTAGCGILDDIEPYLAPTAAQVVLLHVPLDDLGVQLEGAPASGTAITVTLMRVGQSGTAFSEEDLLTGASVKVHLLSLGEDTWLDVPEIAEQPGVYSLNSVDEPRLTYDPGTNYRVEIDHNGEHYEVSQVVPDITHLKEPLFEDFFDPGSDVKVSWEPKESNAFVAAFNTTGEMVYSNFPTDPSGFYTFLTEPSTTSKVIPGAAVAAQDIYVLAAAAMRQADWESNDGMTWISENLNPLGTFFLAGSAAVTAVTTVPLESLQSTLVEVEDDGDGGVGLTVQALKVDLASWFQGEQELVPIIDEVWLTTSDSEFALEMDPSAPGVYHLPADPAGRVPYRIGQPYRVTLRDVERGRDRWLTGVADAGITLRDAGGLAVTVGQDLEIGWAPACDGATVTVWDAFGVEVFSKTLAPGDAEDPGFEAATVPGEAFSRAGVYSVGVVGLQRSADLDQSYAVNPELSVFLSGGSEYAPITVSEAP